LAPIKPGYLIQENINCGQEMVTAYIGKDDGRVSNIICTLNVNFFNWGIAQQSEDKVKAMQFLNFAYSNPDWNNLMNFGIEGEDYERVSGSETFIDYPVGKDASSAYHLNMGWMLPNQFIGYVWNGQPEDVWQQYRDFNASAVYSKAFGFIYDASSVANELTALFGVSNEYRASLETGSVPDVEGTLATFNERLYAAGLQKVMDLKQTQLDEWLASK
jgi:putative aldouronate transport system substrate-binding protein